MINALSLSLTKHCTHFKARKGRRCWTPKSGGGDSFCPALRGGEFDGINYCAAQDPEALGLGDGHQVIYYNIDQMASATSAARVADRLRANQERVEVEERGGGRVRPGKGAPGQLGPFVVEQL